MTPHELAVKIAALLERPAHRQQIEDMLAEWQNSWQPVITYSANPYTTSTWNYPTFWPAEPQKPKLTREEREGYQQQFKDKQQCIWCGGFHLRACPRVKRIVWRNKEEPAEAEYWPDGQWPKDNVIFPEDIFEEEEE